MVLYGTINKQSKLQEIDSTGEILNDKAQPTPGQLPIEFHIQLHTPRDLIYRRIAQPVLGNYLRALEVSALNYLINQKLESGLLVLHGLLTTNHKTHLEIQQYLIDPATKHWRSELSKRVAQVPVPVIESGAIAFTSYVSIGDGFTCLSEGMISLEPAFSTLRTGARPDGLQEAFAVGRETPDVEFERFYDSVLPEPGLLDRFIGLFFESKPLVEYRLRANANIEIELIEYPGDSLEIWQQAVQEREFSKEALISRAEFHRYNGRLKEACDDFSQAIEKDPQDARLYFGRSGVLAPDSLEGALKDLDRAIAISPDFSHARFRRGQLLLQLDATKDAMIELEKCTDLRPVVPAHHLFMVRLFIQERGLEQAKQRLKLLADVDPHDADRLALDNYVLRLEGKESFSDDDIDAIRNGLVHSPFCWSLRYELLTVLEQRGEFDQLLAEAEPFLEAFPADLDLQVICANANIRLSRFGEAMRIVESGLKAHPDNPDLLCIKGHCLFNEDELDAAGECFEDLLAREPNHQQAAWMLGQVNLQARNFSDAVENFEHYNQIAHDPYADHMIAICLANQGELKEAVAIIQLCIEEIPDNVSFQHLYATLLLDLNETQQALEQINTAIELAPKHPGLRFLRAKILLALTNSSGALDELNRAIELDPDFAEAIEVRARIHAQNEDFSAAERDYSKLVDKFPMSSYPLVLRAGFWQQTGEELRAERDMEGALKRHPNAADELVLRKQFLRAEHCFHSEEYEEALGICDEIEVEERNVLATRLRALVYWYDEQFVEATDEFSKCLELFEQQFEPSPNEFWIGILSSRGQAYAEMGEFELAIEDLTTVIEAETIHAGPIVKAYSRSGRGLALAGLFRFEEATEDFRLAIAQTPDNSWLHYNQALCHLQKKENDRAKICLELALNCSNPKLTPRKRNKAIAFVKSLNEI